MSATEEPVRLETSGPEPRCKEQHVDEKDDMFDAARDLEGYELLPRALRVLKEQVSCPYWHSNWEARRQQKSHQRITRWALVAGTLAVVLAILQLPLGQLEWRWLEKALPWVESGCALLAGGFVIYGIILSVQKNWLLERHKAERLRFLKYTSLLTLATGETDVPDIYAWEKDLRTKAEEICRIEEDDLRRWWQEGPEPILGDSKPENHLPAKDVLAILTYYRKKRLEKQLTYFLASSDKATEQDSATRILPLALFLTSILCAISHLLLSNGIRAAQYWFHLGTVSWEHKAGMLLITLAAMLPVLGAAVRTHRSAHEFSRNTVRYRAVYQKLLRVEEHLKYEPEPDDKLDLLVESEETLENEHCEWLRLMDEAEWYG